MTEEEELSLKREVKRLQLEIAGVKRENETIYGLLAGAHLNLRQHLKYGFNPATATSTLVSVGQFYPKLKEKMDEQGAT
jgi:hypothetical protein